MAISCQPSDLVAAAKCFTCIPRSMQDSVRTYLLCQWAAKPKGQPPAAPLTIDIDAINSADGATIINWTQGAAPDHNEVWKSTNGGPFFLLATVGGGGLTFTDGTPMLNGDIFTYKVRGTNVFGGGPFSGTVSSGKELDFSAKINASFPDLIVVYNSFSGHNSATLLSVSAPKLRVVGFDVSIYINANLTTINLGALTTFGDICNLSLNPLLTSLQIYALAGAVGPFYINNNTALAGPVAFANATAFASDFGLFNCPAITSLSLPNVATIGSLNANGCTLLAALSAPLLVNLGIFDVTGTAIVNLSLPSLAGVVSGNFYCGVNTHLASISLASGPNFNADFGGSGCTNLVAVNLFNTFFADAAQNIFFINAKLNQPSVDAVLHRCLLSGLTTVTIDLSGGTSSAPSAAGQLDKAQLIANGCTVNTN